VSENAFYVSGVSENASCRTHGVCLYVSGNDGVYVSGVSENAFYLSAASENASCRTYGVFPCQNALCGFSVIWSAQSTLTSHALGEQATR